MHIIATAAGSSSISPGNYVLAIVLWVGSFVAYWLPLIIGWRRHVRSLGALAVVNAFLGWTVVGWIVALAMAARSTTPAPVREA
jgi:hypothetical protein